MVIKMKMRILKRLSKAIALPLAVMLLLNAVPVVSYAVDDGGADPALTGEDMIDTSTWDANFVAALQTDYPDLFDGENLVKSKVAAVTSLSLYSKEIQSLEGVEYFTALTDLSCGGNNLMNLDLSNNTALTYLSCYNNELTVLDLPNNTALTEVDCRNNNLTNLNLSNCMALVELECRNNNLTDLDLSDCTALTELNCGDNNITALDLSHNTALTKLWCSNNNLTSLDVSQHMALTDLSCAGNNITTLDVSNNTALTKLVCTVNNLTDLNISNNTALTRLGCDSNNITALDLSNNTALTELWCSHNNINSLDLSNNTVLADLQCQNNKLTALDLSNNVSLNYLDCDSNNLTDLDLSHCPNLDTVICCSNNLTVLDLSKNANATCCCEANPIQRLIRPTGEELTISIEPSDGGSITVLMHNNPYNSYIHNINTLENLKYSATPTEGYTFAGWTGDVTSSEPEIEFALSSDMAITANFSKNVTAYTVTFLDWDGTVLKTETVAVGEAATAPEAPTRTGYAFTGWDKSFDAVTSDLTVTAQYEQETITYTVTFKDWDDRTLKTETVNAGEAATAPEAPARTGYTFTGWDKGFDAVTSDLTVTAQYEQEIVIYTVTFKDWDGTTLKTETVNAGEAATAPEAPTRTGYTFTGWDKSFDAVTSDLTVTAQYEQKTASEILEDAKELDPSNPDDTEKVEELEDVYKSLTNISVNVIADPNTHGNFKNNIDAIQVVGASFNAEPDDTVMLHFSKPANNVVIDGTRYKTNSAVQLDIKLLKNGNPMQDLAVPVTITVPIPSGVAEENFWILHHHNDGTLERIQPTVNGDGTCTFSVNRFSVFVFVNAADQNNNTNTDTVQNDSRSGGTSSVAAPSPDAPATPKGTLSTSQAIIRTRAAVQKAKQSGAARATVSLKNMETLTRQAAQAIVKEAGGFPVRVQADSTLNNGKIVVRLSFDPAQITDTIQLAAFTDSAKTKSVRTLFNKYFENNIQVVRLEQKGDFGMPVNLAVKLDAKLQGKTLYFYRYNQAGNAYTRIAAPQYRIDANGYVHFTTKFAGYIVISDGSLTEK